MKTTSQIIEGAPFLAPLKSQEEYRQNIASFICMHIARNEAIDNGLTGLPPLSILVTGPSGVGKSYVVSELAKSAGVPFIQVDCSAITLEGWKGSSIGDMIYQSISSGDVSSDCIVWLDEFDKLAMKEFHNENNPQPNFLRLYDGAIHAEDKERNPIIINTNRMSFIYSGAFAGISDIIDKRIHPVKLGFSKDELFEDELEIQSKITFEDVEKYGIMGELCGRIGAIYSLKGLTDEDYTTLLKGSKGSVLQRYKNLFSSFAINLDMTDEACNAITDIARGSRYGARSASPLIQELLMQQIVVIEEDMSITDIIIDYSKEIGVFCSFIKNEKGNMRRNANSHTLAISPPTLDINFYHNVKYNPSELVDYMKYLYCKNSKKTRKQKDELEVLTAFLFATILYFKMSVNSNEMNFKSLLKLAETTYITGEIENEKSVFDFMVDDILNAEKGVYKEGDKLSLKHYYEEFKELHTEKTGKMLVKAIKIIRQRWYTELTMSV